MEPGRWENPCSTQTPVKSRTGLNDSGVSTVRRGITMRTTHTEPGTITVVMMWSPQAPPVRWSMEWSGSSQNHGTPSRMLPPWPWLTLLPSGSSECSKRRWTRKLQNRQKEWSTCSTRPPTGCGRFWPEKNVPECALERNS